MGYYVKLIDGQFRIPRVLLGEAFDIWCELNKRDDLKTGGNSNEKWFAWMDVDFPATALQAVADGKAEYPAQAVLMELGFEVELDDYGLIIRDFEDRKTGAESVFLEAIAPLVDPGSYLEWKGEEDDDYWRQLFRQGRMYVQRGRLSFEWDKQLTLSQEIEKGD